MANQTMERALTFAGYEVQHVWGDLGHDGHQGESIFPDVMRYLWKDWPTPVKAGSSRNGMLNDIVSGETAWQPATSLTDSDFSATTARAHNGNIYAAVRGKNAKDPSHLTLVRQKGKAVTVATGDQRNPTGITLSPDQTLLYVADGASHWVWSYQIQPDGTLLHGQKYYWLHSPDDADDSGASAMCVDRDGRLYVATRMGIQVCDQAGRVNVILPLPGGAVTEIGWTGANSETLSATTAKGAFTRQMKITGTRSTDAPNRPNPPGL
jgi:gluconolactonase